MGPITRAEFFKLLTLLFAGFFFSDESKALTSAKTPVRVPPRGRTRIKFTLEDNVIDVCVPCQIDIEQTCDWIDVTTFDTPYGYRERMAGLREATLTVDIPYTDQSKDACMAFQGLMNSDWYWKWAQDNKMGFEIPLPNHTIKGAGFLYSYEVLSEVGEPIHMIIRFNITLEPDAYVNTPRGQRKFISNRRMLTGKG